uniref:Uncharacterized protein n=1 Tax=Cacopsylla melanoneura TaxID=428564 RepID=A0A8D8RY43_9HEMI
MSLETNHKNFSICQFFRRSKLKKHFKKNHFDQNAKWVKKCISNAKCKMLFKNPFQMQNVHCILRFAHLCQSAKAKSVTTTTAITKGKSVMASLQHVLHSNVNIVLSTPIRPTLLVKLDTPL